MSAKSVKFMGAGVSGPANPALTSRVDLANPVAGWVFPFSPHYPMGIFPRRCTPSVALEKLTFLLDSDRTHKDRASYSEQSKF